MSASVQPANNEAQYANPVPAALRRQTERVNDIARRAGMAGVPEEVKPDPVPAPVGADPAPAPAAPAAAPAPAPVHTPPAAPADDFEQKYRTLQGKYDAEVPALRAQLNGMERILATLNDRPAPTPAPAHVPVAETPTVVSIPQKDIDDFGQELIDVARRAARAEFMPIITELRAELGKVHASQTQLQTRQQETATMTGRQRAEVAMDTDSQLGSTWRQINEDPKFWQDWCGKADPFSGQQRIQLLRHAFDVGDVPRFKAFFTAYLNEHTEARVPAPAVAHTPAPPVLGTGRPTLEDLAAPGRVSGPAPAPGAQADKRIWTQQAIITFYNDVRKGTFDGREAEKLRLEQDLFAAPLEGRVR